mmetsp:Transcript_12447/g.23670  ORF Transcript_12447/g.23670 Transcript_12447/m.23670 type:complete len:200 (-) Transcript_12447:63-662(-)
MPRHGHCVPVRFQVHQELGIVRVAIMKPNHIRSRNKLLQFGNAQATKSPALLGGELLIRHLLFHCCRSLLRLGLFFRFLAPLALLLSFWDFHQILWSAELRKYLLKFAVFRSGFADFRQGAVARNKFDLLFLFFILFRLIYLLKLLQLLNNLLLLMFQLSFLRLFPRSPLCPLAHAILLDPVGCLFRGHRVEFGNQKRG